MRRSQWLLFAAAAGLTAAAPGQDEEGPDLGFLEYLGSWEDSDEEWVLAVELKAEVEKLGEESRQDDKDEDTDEAEDGDED